MTTTDTQPDGEAVPMTTAVTAIINGIERHCEIRRSDLRFFESVHGPALWNLNRIRDHQFDTELLRAVIEFATGERPAATESGETFRLTFLSTARKRRADSAWIDEAFEKNGPLRYVGLAGMILAATLSGIRADAATFDDEEF